jgi:hypothetical protein
LSFHFDPEFYEGIVQDVPGAAGLTLESAALPPHARRIHLLTGADAALDDPSAIEEFAYELAASAVAAQVDAGAVSIPRVPNAKRIQSVLHWIERNATQRVLLAGLEDSVVCLA